MKTIETYLPIFPGFYNTLFECENESDIIHSYNQENNTDYECDDFEWDYLKYQNGIAINCCKAIEKLLKENNIIKSLKFQKVVSPKYYNYSNDSINIEVDINLDELICFIANNKDSFSQFIESNYTSCDGFTSFHSNNGDEWLKGLIKNDLDKPEHKFGSLLNFVCEMLIGDDSNFWLYSQLENYDYCEPNYTLIEK